MSDDIVPYVMHESGNIPGIPGIFGGGQTVWVDMDTREVVSQQPFVPPVPPTKEEPPQKKEDTKTEKLPKKASQASDEIGE